MANFNLNKILLGGRLTADPELKQTQTGISVATFSVAVNRRVRTDNNTNNQPTADFFNVTAWRERAEFVTKFFRKGASIFIVGSLQNRSWTDQQGQKRYATDIVADEIYFVDSRAEAPQGETYVPEVYTAPQAAPSFEEVKADDDLPF